MKSLLTIAVLSLALMTPSFAQAVPVEKVCLPDELRTGDKARFTAELLKANPIQFTPALLDGEGSSKGLFQLLRTINPYGDECASIKENCSAAKNIRSIAEALLDRRVNDRRYLVEWVGDGAEPVGEDKLEAFLRTNPTHYRLECRPEAVEEARRINEPVALAAASACSKDDRLCLGVDRLQIAKTIAEIQTKEDRKKRDPLKFSVSLDRQNPTRIENADGSVTKIANDDVSFTGALAMVDIFNSAQRRDRPSQPKDLTPSVSPFVSLVYDENPLPDKEIDDLTIGLTSTWRLPFVERGKFFDNLRPELSIGWISDIEQRESAQWAATARLPLPLESVGGIGRFLEGTGYGGAAQESFSLRPAWSIAAILDYGEIVRVGDKVALQTIPRYYRVGYDLSSDWLLLAGGPALPRTSLEIDYFFRDDISGEPANADLFSGSMTFKPSESSDFSLNLTYESGETLTSLTEQETWKLGFGYKR